MPYSQNGFYASPDPGQLLIGDFKVPGTSINFPMGIASFAAPLLIWVAEQIHYRVEPLRAGWCWGYYYRDVRGQSTVLSNHSSGTAIDVNAPAHPRGARGTWSTAEIAEIRAILAEANRDARVIVWGHDFATTIDAMHFECRGTKQQVIDAGRRLTQKDWFAMATKAELKEAVGAAITEMEPTLQRICQEAVQAELGNAGVKIVNGVWAKKLEDPTSTTTPKAAYTAGGWLRGDNLRREQLKAHIDAAATRIISAFRGL